MITSTPFVTDELILEEVTTMHEGDENNNLADGVDAYEEEKAPSSREMGHSLETLQNYYLFSINRGRQIMGIIFNPENLVIAEKFKNYKQCLLLIIS